MRRFWIFVVQVILLCVCSAEELSAKKKNTFLRALANHLNDEIGQEYIYEGGVILSCTSIVSNNLCFEVILNVISTKRLSWVSSSIILLLSRSLKLQLFCQLNLLNLIGTQSNSLQWQ